MKRSLLICFLTCLFISAAGRAFAYENYVVNRGSFWNGRVWIMKTERSCSTCRGTVELISLSPNSNARPRVEHRAVVPTTNFWLLANRDRLWLIGEKYLAYFDGDDLNSITPEEPFQEIFRPFIYKDTPSVFEKRGDDIAWLMLENEQWVEKKVFQLRRENKVRVSRLQAIVIDERIHLFWNYDPGEYFYYQAGMPAGNETEPGPKVSVKDVYRLTSASIGNTPVVLYNQRDRFAARVRGLKLVEDKWRPFFTGPKIIMGSESDYGIYSTGHGDEFVLLHRGFGGYMYAYTCKQGQVARRLKFGRFNFSSLMMFFLPVILFLTFVMLISVFVLNKIGSLWFYKIGIPVFRQERRYPAGTVDINALCSPEILKTAKCVNRVWPKKKTLLIGVNPKNIDSTVQAAMAKTLCDATLEIQGHPDEIILKLNSRVPLPFILASIMLFFVPLFLAAVLSGMMKPIGYVVLFGLILLICFLDVRWYLKAKRNSGPLWELVLSRLGLEEALPETDDVKSLF